MANDIRGEVAFQALGRDWTLKLGNGAVRDIEASTGKPFPQVGKDLADEATASISLLTLVFCAALKKQHPDINMNVCDDIIDEIGHEQAGTLLGQAFLLMQPQGKGGADARPRKATAQ